MKTIKNTIYHRLKNKIKISPSYINKDWKDWFTYYGLFIKIWIFTSIITIIPTLHRWKYGYTSFELIVFLISLGCVYLFEKTIINNRRWRRLDKFIEKQSK